MRRITDGSRLKLHSSRSRERIAASLGLPIGDVTKYTRLAAAAGLRWPAMQLSREAALERQLGWPTAVSDNAKFDRTSRTSRSPDWHPRT